MTISLPSLLPVNGIGLPVARLTYIVSGAHLEWSRPGDRSRATESGEYVARNVAPARMAMRHDGVIYLAMPRLRRGVPFTLGAVEYDPCVSTIEPPVSPYPCAAAHRNVAQSGTGTGNWTVVNVVDVHLDDGGVLWALDVGKVNLLEGGATVVVRPPMVFAFDTDTDEIVRAIDLSRATTEASCLQSIVVDHSSTAGQFVYVSDAGLGNVIVYNVACDSSFKVHVPVGPCGQRDVMYMAPVLADVMDMAAGRGSARYRRLYVTYLSSRDMIYVPVHVVDESTVDLPTVNVGRKPCKMIVLGTDRGSVIYFRTDGDTGEILSWDVNKLFRHENFRSVQRGRKSRIPLMVITGFQGYQWSMESNYVDFLVGDIGCLGVSTRIEPLQIHDEYPDDPCSNRVPMRCGQGRTTAKTIGSNGTKSARRSTTIVNKRSVATIAVVEPAP
ncbi:uncharacterized protein LOC113550419 [Rhopalosiphum maidis]|uniref:uncharacterized protein LOC113550419 n=1 Tax=Rhopalosiphum maidis TaxID=43146 RepID=UPI000F00DA9F|nr:uncharacterized protein LOC113550419 [Rhopalosiphum maidis]